MPRNTELAVIETSEDLEKLFRTYGDFIYRFILVRTGYFKELAEDLTQDTFMKVWQHRTSFDPSKSSIKTWLFSIARNLIIDFYRKAERKYMVLDSQILEFAGFQTDFAANADYKLILNKMNELNMEEQEILNLRYIEGFTIEETANIIQKSIPATKVFAHRAMEKLRKAVNQ